MLKKSPYPEEARKMFIRANLLDGEEPIESLLGRKIILRFDLLKVFKNGSVGPKLTRNGCQYVNEEGKLVDRAVEITPESITSSCTIEGVVVTGYIDKDRQDKFRARKGKLNLVDIRICISDLMLGESLIVDYLTIKKGNLYLAYWLERPENEEDLENDDQAGDDEESANEGGEDPKRGYGVAKVLLIVDEFGVV